MARAAAATAVLNRELGSLSKDSVRTKRSMSDIDDGVVRVGSHAEKSGSQIDKLSGRMRILADVAAILGPSLVPIGGVGIAAVAGLASEFGFAAIGAGTALLAFQGVGDALKAVNKAAIEPTAANLDAARVAMDKLGPSGREFVAALQQVIPQLKQLQVAAADGILPGVAEGLQSVVSVLPRLEGVIGAVSNKLGEIAADTGKALASDEWDPFLAFLEAEAPKALGDMATIAGNAAHTLADLWMAFTPIDNGFSQFLVDSSADIERWAAGLAQTQGFQEFVAYIQDTGPQVAETFGAIANATVQIVEAAAPLGGPVLQGVTALANLVSGIADSDLGTPIFGAVAALALLNRTIAISGALQKSTFGGPAIALMRGESSALKNLTADWRTCNSVTRTAQGRAQATAAEMEAANAAAGRLSGRLRSLGKGAAVVGGLAVASTGAADSIGLTNAASLGLLGTFIGPEGAVAGGLIGAFLDAKDASKGLSNSLNAATRSIETGNVDAMSKSLRELKKQQEDNAHHTGFRDFFSDIGKQAVPIFEFKPSLKDQLDAQVRSVEFFRTIDGAIQQVATGEEFMRQGFIATSTGIDMARQSAEDFQKAIEDVNNTLAGRQNARSFEQDIIDFNDRKNKIVDLKAQLAHAESKAGGKGASPSEALRLDRLSKESKDASTPAARKKAAEDLAALQTTIANRTSAQQKQAAADVKRIREELKLYTNTLDISTEAGNRNQAMLDQFGTNLLNAANTLDQFKNNPALRAAFIDAAREKYIKMGEAFGLTAKQAEKAADKAGLLDTVAGKHVRIVIDSTGAIRVIDTVAERLRRLQRLGDLKLNIAGADNKRRAGGSDGDPNTPWYSGGFTGRGGVFEPAGIVHRGEVGIPQHLVNRDWSMLQSRYGHLPGFANGGYVQPFPPSAQMASSPSTSATVRLSDNDIQRLAVAMSNVRPLYGDVHMQPHNYSEFTRELDRARRMSSADGVQR